jgi:NADH:ubiquinone oxidoreductase subunit 6 (subunit J)
VLGVAACCGAAVGSSLALLIRRDRSVQVLALGVLSLALAVAFLLSGAALPGLGALLVGVLAEVVLLSPATRSSPDPDGSDRRSVRTFWVPIALSALAALAALGLLVGAGVASRAQLAAQTASSPSVAQVGHQLVMGAGVAVLAVALLAATTVVGGAAVIQRDPREAVEEQLRQARSRRLEAQRRRQAQREAARAAARAARRRRGG